MLYSCNISSQEPGLSSIHEPYRGSNSSKGAYLKSQSEKNIRTKQSTEPSTDRQTNQEPFYFKLSNSNKILPTKRVEPKHELINVQNMKKILNHHYSEEISIKSQRLRAEQRKRIMEERDYLSKFEKHKQFEKRRVDRLKSDYNKDLHEQINKRRAIMEVNKAKQRQYDLSFKSRQNSLVHKAQAWRNFYDQAYSFRDNVAREYNQYMKQQKKYQQKRNKSQLLNLYSDHKDYSQQRQFERHIKEHQKQTLKNILDKQINEKSQKTKEITINAAKMEKQAYHPILNPIDFKIDLKNRYLLQQITPKKFFL